MAFRLPFLSFFHLPLKIKSLIVAGDGTDRLPESVKPYRAKPEDHVHLVKLTARCWVWEELLPFLCRVEDCSLLNLICEFLFREFPDTARVKHISHVPLWHVTTPEPGGNPAMKLWDFSGLGWTSWTYCVLQDHLQWQKRDVVTQVGPFRDTFLVSFHGGVTVVPMACPSTL